MKTYIYAAAVIVLITSYSAVFHYGRVFERDIVNEAIRDYQESVTDQVENEKQRREVIYRDRIKIVKEASDDCLDRPMPDSIVNVLRADDPS